MIQDIMDFLSQADPEVGASIQKDSTGSSTTSS